MTPSRILRRPVQADDRIRLGPAVCSVPLIDPPPPSSVVPEPPQANAAHVRRIEQLEAQLAEMQREREQLHARMAELEGQLAAERSDAQQAGYAEGLESGRVQAKQELAAHVSLWQKTVEAGAREYEAALQKIRDELAEIVMAAAAKLLGDQAANPGSVRTAIEHTLREAGIGGAVRVLIAPAQYEQLARQNMAHVAALRERRVEVAPDPRVTAGGCLIETGSGLIDGRFEVELQRLEEIVSGHFDSQRGPAR